MYKLGLNFSPLVQQDFTFTVYRKSKISTDKKDKSISAFSHNLPKILGGTDYSSYWISFENLDGYASFECNSKTNFHLTKRFISNILIKEASKNLVSTDYFLDNKSKYSRVNFILQNHKEGNEVVWCEPYYLQRNDSFGFLLDFKFIKNPDLDFSRKVQELSLSLTSIGRSNTEIISDKYQKIKSFAQKYYNILFKDSIIDFGPIQEIESDILKSKIFIAKDGSKVNSQSKVRNIGPFQDISGIMNILFLHKESERKIIAAFYESLQNELFNSFNANVKFHGYRCDEIDEESIAGAIKMIQDGNFKNAVVIVLKSNEIEDNDMYYRVKYNFCKVDVPVQFINYNTIKNKYSVRDFALQIFSKVGGIPWIVDVKDTHSLIIGLAQSINFEEVDDEKKMNRYYAYSIIMDNQGLFHSVKIISDNLNKSDYLTSLRKTISDVVKKKSNNYDNVVIHAPFRITEEEIEKISSAIKSISSKIEFCVIRLNQFNKYYGYNKTINSLVPYEGSLMRISNNQYLLWTEGITRENTVPKKRYSGPIHIEVMHPSGDGTNHLHYLQDLINLSGMNWRAYNSKSVPLSIQYCELVTDFVKEFNIRGYPKLTEDNIKPWFL